MPTRRVTKSGSHRRVGEQEVSVSRRAFIGGALAAASASTAGGLPGLAAQTRAAEVPPPTPSRKITLGLIGCGGRGAWITGFFVKHGGFQFRAVADYFQDVAEGTGAPLGIDKARCFWGLSGYKRLIDSGVDAVVIEDVPCFYPEQAQAAVDAGCHVYIAKPIAVDVPGCLAIGAAAKRATQKKRCFLVDYQLPTQTPNIEVANRIREGGLGRLGHVLSYGLCGGGGDPPDGPTIEHLFRQQLWTSRVALGGDNFAYYDIHIIDGVTWIMGKRPVGASGRSRIFRPTPHGDRSDCSGVMFDYDDGVIWNHATNAVQNNCDLPTLTAEFYGTQATARVQYWGKAYVRGGPRHYVGAIGSIYDDGVACNVAQFHRNISEGHFENPTAQRAVDGTLIAILGREAALRRRYLTLQEVIQENKRWEVNLKGLKT